MSDIKKKLDGLASQFGMIPAKDLRPGKSRPRSSQPANIESETGELQSTQSGGLLSAALSAQLRARMGLESMPAPTDSGEHSQPQEITEVLPGEVIGDDHYGFYLYRRVFPLDYGVGIVPLGIGLHCDAQQIALSACDKALRQFDPRKTCYMDTETTGLAGGAGTVAFLTGMGFYADDGFVLEQCFLRDYDDEGAMLEYLAEKLQHFECIVSYNGKSFDLPLLRSRFVQHRLPFPLTDTVHYDLVHAARRVWKQRLNNCSLNNIERLVLNFHRQEDVPGHLIPQLWLDYLEYRDARPLKDVFHHHEMDILSLAALAGHLSQRLAARDEPAFHHAEDQLSVIRLYYKNKEYESVVEHAGQFLERARATDMLRREGLFLLAMAAKRLGQFEEMHTALMTLHDEYPEDIPGATELAKFIEHQHRNIQDAAQICRETLEAVRKIQDTPGISDDFTFSALRGRLKRLEEKQARLKKRHDIDGENFL